MTEYDTTATQPVSFLWLESQKLCLVYPRRASCPLSFQILPKYKGLTAKEVPLGCVVGRVAI